MNAALTPETPLFIVMNAASGSADPRQARRTIEQVLHEGGRRHTVFEVKDPRQLRATAARAVEAAERAEGAVVAAGGDGTINCVAHETLETGRPFGIIPQGTFNYSCRARGIPLATEPATRALLQAELTPMQVGRVNDRLFLVNASLGMYPRLLEEREQYKRRYGRRRLVALWAALRTILRDDQRLTLELDHDQQRELIQTCTLFVGNNPLQLAQAGLPEAEDVEERRRLAAVVVCPLSRVERLGLALHALSGRLGSHAQVRDFSFRRMTVRPTHRVGKRGVKVALDGEVHWLMPPLRFEVASRPLMLMTPPAAEA